MRKDELIKQESGRSMVEMLGVLAVIGVLSVAGIAGFKTAMTRHKANEIMQTVSIANNDMQIGHTPQFLEVAGATFGTTGEYQGKPAFVTVDIEDENVCKHVKNLAEGTFIIEGGCSESEANAGKNYCSEAATPHYAKNCCAGVTLDPCQKCNSKTGKVSDSSHRDPCDGGLGWCENGNCHRCNEVYPGTGTREEGYDGGNADPYSICYCPTGKVWRNNQCRTCDELYPGTGAREEGYFGQYVTNVCRCPTGKSWNHSQNRCVW